MMKLYKYIGPKEILKLVKESNTGEVIGSAVDVLNWLKYTNQILDDLDQLIVTFVIDKDNRLLIVDRHSEHVVCAGGEEVLSAGEITFELIGEDVKVTHVTNQSTGYCPEPGSWVAVQKALEIAGIKHPGKFSISYDFRLCENDDCDITKVLVKENWYYCPACGSELNREWNFD